MEKEVRQLVADRCLEVERRLSAQLRHEIDTLAQIIETTIAKKEDVHRLQEQIDELQRA
jgi:hypothetical protein